MKSSLRHISLGIVWAALLFALFHLYFLQPYRNVLMDFTVYLEAGSRFRQGEDIYNHTYEVTARDGRNFNLFYFYPPLLAALMGSVAHFSVNSIKLVWCALNIGCILGSILYLTKIFRSICPQLSSSLVVPSILFAIIAFEPAFTSAMEGQVNLIILFLLSAALWLFRPHNYPWSGALLGLATSIKISPLVISLAFISSRAWLGLSAMGLTVLALSALPLLISPRPELLHQFFSPFGALVSGTLERHYVFNYAADKALLNVLGLDHFDFLRKTMRFFLYLTPLVITVVARTRQHVSLSKEYLLSSLLLCCMVLISPTLWFHHLVWLIPVFVIACAGTFKEFQGNISRDALYKRLLILGACYFIMSQANQLHVLALSYGNELTRITAIVPSLSIFLLISLLLRGSSLRGKSL